jgi:hypothetical protein
MEFGETIPLFFITVCCIGVIPIFGFALLVIIRFSLKDRQLARNIFFSVLGVAVIAYLYPIWQMILSLPLLLHVSCGCDTPIVITPAMVGEMFLSSVQQGVFLVYPGMALGFIFAFAIVLPITLVVRFFTKEKAISGSNNG